VNPTVSDTIRLARILCILLLVYAHAQPHQAQQAESLLSPMGAIQGLRQLLGHTSVPLLSLISGYLLALSLSRRPYGDELRLKFATLIVPLVLWNLIVITKNGFESGFTVVPAPEDWPNAVLALTAYPAMAPLYFLRDAFVCFLVSPALLLAARHRPASLGTALLLNAVFDLDGPLFINSAIPLFYFAGCVWQVRQLPIPGSTMPRGPVWAAGLAMVALSVAPFHLPPAWGLTNPLSAAFAAADIALRVAGCLVFWFLASRLVHSRAGQVLMRFEPMAFFLFCAHGMAAGLWWMLLAHLGQADAAPVFLTYFALSPALALSGCLAAVWVLQRVAPKALSLLMGGRAPDQRQMDAMVRPLSREPLAPPAGHDIASIRTP
jgi:hypothetical protein